MWLVRRTVLANQPTARNRWTPPSRRQRPRMGSTLVEHRLSDALVTMVKATKEVHDDIWLVSFMDYDLAYFGLETRVLEPLENPFAPKVLPMS